jgi:hypothetical protein
MRTTVDIDPHLLRRLRDEAHRRAVPFKEFLMTVIRRGLEDRPARSRARYRSPSFPMGETAPGLDLDKALALAGALEDEEIVRKFQQRK